MPRESASDQSTKSNTIYRLEYSKSTSFAPPVLEPSKAADRNIHKGFDPLSSIVLLFDKTSFYPPPPPMTLLLAPTIFYFGGG